jgi:hypothetical protein
MTKPSTAVLFLAAFDFAIAAVVMGLAADLTNRVINGSE